MIEASSNNHRQSEDNEVELRISKRTKTTKTLGLDFLTFVFFRKWTLDLLLDNVMSWSFLLEWGGK